MMVLQGVFGEKAYYFQLEILSDLNMQLLNSSLMMSLGAGA